MNIVKTVVMVTYFFPPEGQAGAYRPLRFVRHLSPVGWNAKIISALVHQYERYDPDLLAEVPNEMEVVRIRFCDPWQAIQSWRHRNMQGTLSGASVETIRKIRGAQHGTLRAKIRGINSQSGGVVLSP